ncbi:hypothetical protein [Thermus caldilimi]|uniref:hypothetical protein n=1 Tax=Thermus caldilimi TaxID=2483360 RepID=UPI001076AFB6|nr:hypothetical protein [Thermus caldilimi]
MPRGEHLIRNRPPKEVLAARLGQEPLGPGEAGLRVYVRGEEAALRLFKALSAKERGRVVEAGLEALGYLREGEDA